jgi:hypothetical protein
MCRISVPPRGDHAMLKRCALLSTLFLAIGNLAAAKNMVLHCSGYQVGDEHPLTDQIITLDLQNNTVISIQLGPRPKDIVNAPVKVGKQELQWSYEAVNKVYVLNRQSFRLHLLSEKLELIGIFECSASS